MFLVFFAVKRTIQLFALSIMLYSPFFESEGVNTLNYMGISKIMEQCSMLHICICPILFSKSINFGDGNFSQTMPDTAVILMSR